MATEGSHHEHIHRAREEVALILERRECCWVVVRRCLGHVPIDMRNEPAFYCWWRDIDRHLPVNNFVPPLVYCPYALDE